MDRIWFLEEVNLFKILCPHYYNAYKKSHKFSAYNKNEYIYFTKDIANKIYLIDKGKVKIGYYTESGEEVIKSILVKGEIFGEKAILGKIKHNEFAQAMTKNTSICSISSQNLQGLMLKNRKLSIKLYKFIGFRIKKLERRLELLLFKDVKTRIIEFIAELEKDYGRTLANGNVFIKHPYTQKNMASLIGTSRSTFNIIMNNLKEENYLDFHRNEIILKK